MAHVFTFNKTFLAVALWVSTSPVHALGLVEAYSFALRHDPTFQAAIKENDAGQEYENIGRAGLLPRVNANYQNMPHNWQKQDSSSTNFFGQTQNVTERQKYKSYSGSISLTQPLFDYEAWSRYQMGIAQSLMANERYRIYLLDLAVRVTNAYLEVTQARDQLELVTAQIKTYEQQLTLNKVMLDGGEGTITDISETEAAWDLAKAHQIEAQNTLESSQRTLGSLTGIPLTEMNTVQSLQTRAFTFIPLSPGKYAQWESLSLKHNPIIAETQHGVKVAKHDIERSRAGFMPTVNLYASHAISDSGSDNTIGQRYRTDSVGLQVSMPLFSGGETAAMTRQSAARYEQAMHTRDAQVANTLNELHTQYDLVQSSQARISAYQSAVKNAEVRLTSTRKSVMAGERSNLDVITAAQQLYTARADLMNAKYTYIKAYIGLLNNAGVLKQQDITRVARYFSPVSTRVTDAN